MALLKRLQDIFQLFQPLSIIAAALILFFGMAALRNTLVLIEEYETLLTFYSEEGFDLLSLHEAFEEFDHEVKHFIDTPKPAQLDDLNIALVTFSSVFLDKTERLNNRFDRLYTPSFKSQFKVIQSQLVVISDLIGQMESATDPLQFNRLHVEFTQKFQALNTSIHDLWEGVYNKAQYEHFFHQLRIYSHFVYWSVVVLGLFGFVFIVLNAHKMGKLKRVNTEKGHALNLLEQRLAAMEAASDGIAIVDRDGLLQYMNAAFKRMHGIDKDVSENHLGQKWTSLYSADQLKLAEQHILPELYANGFWFGEEDIQRPDGSLISAEFLLTRLPEGGFVVTGRDVTARKKNEQEKDVLQDQFFQAQKMEAIGRLAGGMAHDFNNILAAIKGYTEFLIDDLNPATPQHGFAKKIQEASYQAGKLVEQILSFSRRRQSEEADFDITLPFQECLSLITSTLPRSIAVKVRNAHEGQALPIRGNQIQIAQLIMNLCVNAGDAMENKHGDLILQLDTITPQESCPPEMLVSVLKKEAAGKAPVISALGEDHTRLVLGLIDPARRYVLLQIEDTGSGIPRGIVERMFEPFFTTKPVNKGTGLGLSTVMGVMSAHKGAVLVDTKIGRGTRFELYFPLLNAVLNAASQPDAYVAEKKQAARILLVEDAPDVRHMTSVLLSRLGHTVEEAEDGLAAFEILKHKGGDYFDLVISDQNMPKMTGLELVQASQAQWPDLPFVIITGFSPDQLEAAAQKSSCIRAVLKKPVNRDALTTHIDEIMSGKALSSSLPPPHQK